MKYTYQFVNRNEITYIQEFKNDIKVDGGFMSLDYITNNIDPHRDYKALKNRIKRWIQKEYPELLI